MDTQRLILLFIFGFSVLMLWEAWEKEHRPKPSPPVASATPQAVPTPATTPSAKPAPSAVPSAETAAKGETIRVTTDLLIADIDTLGATLRRVELTHHKDSKDPTKDLVLLGAEHRYEAQSGLTGDAGPNHRTVWRVLPGARSLPARTPSRCDWPRRARMVWRSKRFTRSGATAMWSMLRSKSVIRVRRRLPLLRTSSSPMTAGRIRTRIR